MFKNQLLIAFDKQVNKLAEYYGLDTLQAEYCIYSAWINGKSIDKINQSDVEKWIIDYEEKFPLNQISGDFLNLEGIVE
jgi:hypothetical protein